MAEDPDTPGGWRTAYEDVHRYPRRAFAWEYLRRNARIRATSADRFRRWRASGRDGNMQIFRDETSDTVGEADCLFATSADTDARSATVLWNPDLCPSVLRLLALPDTGDLTRFSLAESALPATLLLSSEGVQHVLIRDGVRSLQLMVRGESLLRPVGLAINTHWDAAVATYQERSWRTLRAFRDSGQLPEACFPPDPHAERLALVLQALDGWRAGARQRDIAVALHGADRVARDWSDPRENLRDQVRYAITRGRTLADHGYRAFLC
jgi:hypothetical protein